MNLTATNQSIEINLASAVSTDWTSSWTDIDKTSSTATDTGSSHGTSSAAGDITVVAAPAANHRIVVTSITIKNTSGSTNTISVYKDVAGTEYVVKTAVLLTGQSLIYTHQAGWDVYNADGKRQADGADGADGAPGAVGVGTSGTTTIDFGVFPGKSDTSVTVTGQATIASGSVVEAWLNCIDSADHTADEHRLEKIKVTVGNIVPGTGFTIYAHNISEISENTTTAPPGQQKAAGGAFTKNRPSNVLKGTRVYGVWNVFWRWS